MKRPTEIKELDLNQPYDKNKFNFTKIKNEEVKIKF